MSKKEAQILDYPAYLIERGGWEDDSFKDPPARAVFDRFRRTKKCPHCLSSIMEVAQASAWADFGPEKDEVDIRLWGCSTCGWWCEIRTDTKPWFREDKSIAVLRKFDSSDAQLPLDVLRKELVKRPQIVYDIHSKKFEELVGSIVRDFYETTVRVIGRRDDKGIDLIYLDGPNPIALQVKRRQDPRKAEQVALVREFLGAMLSELSEGFSHGGIVTTAKHFTKGSYEARDKALGRGLVQKYDLIDAKGFFDMFRFVQRGQVLFPWQGVLDDLVGKWKEVPNAKTHSNAKSSTFEH